jgi:hypothetical protein
MELQFHPGPADDGQRNCPKPVEFHARLNCEFSASSWFYYKEICYDARSHERNFFKSLFFVIYWDKKVG